MSNYLEHPAYYADHSMWGRIANSAIRVGLSKDIVRSIRNGRCPVDAVDELVSQGTVDAGAWASVRSDVLAEQGRVKAMEAERSREYRARKRQEKVATDSRACVVCSSEIKGKRLDAAFCSPKCRVRHNRQFSQLRYLALDPEMNRFKPASQ